MAEPLQFYMDEHFSGHVTHGLRRRGINVLTAQEANRCGLPDEEQLAFATKDDRVMVTFDSDYLALHNIGISHAGIAWCPQRGYGTAMLIQLPELLCEITDRDQMRNHVEYL